MNNDYGGFFNTRMQKTVIFVLLLVAALLATKIVTELKEYKFIGGGVPSSNVITVNGEGEVFAVPDVATFTFSVIEERPNAKVAQDIAAEKINSMLSYLGESDIEEKDIKTVSYNVFPRYDYKREICTQFSCPPGEQVLRGFEVNQTIQVKVRDIDEAGAILAGVGERGVSSVSGLNFTIDDEEELQREARQEAIEDAQSKAKELAKDLGVRIIRVVNFSEFGGPPKYARFDFAIAESAFGVGGDDALTPEIPVGENKIVSNVSITYEIR